jgi:hypothetical protein
MTVLQKCIVSAVLVFVPASVFAQGRVPHTDSGAIGGDVGLFLPRDAALSSGPTLEGFYEYYLSPRISVRTGVGWSNPAFDREHADKLRHVRIALDAVHNWEGGSVHPFVGAGIGVYFLQVRANGNNIGDSESKLGGTIFGGAEFFTNNTTSVKAEARYHLIKNVGILNPDGLALTIGLKKYF